MRKWRPAGFSRLDERGSPGLGCRCILSREPGCRWGPVSQEPVHSDDAPRGVSAQLYAARCCFCSPVPATSAPGGPARNSHRTRQRRVPAACALNGLAVSIGLEVRCASARTCDHPIRRLEKPTPPSVEMLGPPDRQHEGNLGALASSGIMERKQEVNLAARPGD